MGFTLVNDYAKRSNLPIIEVTAGAAIAAGDWVVLAGDDAKYDTVADGGATISGLALTTATADGGKFDMLIPDPFMVFRGPAVGSAFAAGDVGAQFELDVTNGVMSVNQAGTSNKVFTIVGYATGTADVTVIPSAVGPFGSKAV